MTSIGIDIGTTSISAVLVEINSGKVLKSITVSNKTDMSSNWMNIKIPRRYLIR